ncbi:Oxygen-independent coproporphyrinogen-III oxidase 1 [Maioricimonas rarisocia]|uniref:Oxygen-independent coproporphyrinogen-III oxidase 1 n=1 Tax=Maioricimonas rarisocia TaxID=2528026 RepID=A0A517ZG92_9PLAN|nr:coproporphyrinogen-III oxidase family protein [Maioricimonas rarisocia]QDU41506.1 Oxygen-independent coproporphyrinogen-III oxidase 1 [Maioricimonas rarisocia]
MSTDTTTTTEIGSYFISNYPPFSQWSREQVPAAFEALDGEPDESIPLGMYIHIPFCRKRCKFCYFRVYTQQNAETIKNYVDTLDREVQLLKDRPGVAGRNLRFVYFGGGTPSYLSARQLKMLRDRLSASVSWDDAEEVTFECEPGTLSLEKVQTLKEIGVTRVSLGVENFNDKILEENGRAHLSPEILRAYDWIRQVGFPQVNIDLIAGMVGETDENWHACVEKAVELEPDNVTIYQMELPWNTTYSKEMLEHGIESPVADWPTKRRWASEAMDRMLEAGYEISSGNELVGNLETDHFVYRDNLFRGSDILAVGVSSFGHFQGVHYQNLDRIEDYMETVRSGALPINRALVPTDHQRLIREWVLQMKEGRVPAAPFREKFGVDPLVEFAEPLANQQKAGYLVVEDDVVQLTRKGLLQVDSLLTEYFEEEHREVRYT